MKAKKPTKATPLIAWDRTMICREFGLDSRTLGKRLADADLDKKDSFNSREVMRALLGDLGAERIRLTREQADKLAIENAESRRILAPVSELADKTNRAISSIKAAIMAAANLEREDKEKILRRCGELWDEAFGVSPTDSTNVEPTTALHS
jgi:hypothetical protein